MTTPPLTRRETIAAGILQALVSSRDLIDDTTIDQALDLTDRIIAALDRTNPAPVSPLPLYPEHIPAPPDDLVYYGAKGLQQRAHGDDEVDVWAFAEHWEEKTWEQGWGGHDMGAAFHYALRRGSPIARANGILD